MRSIIITSLGLILWSVCLAATKFLGYESGQARKNATYIFIALWFIVSSINLWMGTRAGYSFIEELPIFLMIFLVPGIVAFVVNKKFP